MCGFDPAAADPDTNQTQPFLTTRMKDRRIILTFNWIFICIKLCCCGIGSANSNIFRNLEYDNLSGN